MTPSTATAPTAPRTTSTAQAVPHLSTLRTRPVPPRSPERSGSSTPPAVRARGPVPRTTLAAPWDRLRLQSLESTRSAEEQARALESLANSEIPTDAAGPWAASLARCCVEALLGARPAAQLQRWVTPELYDAISRRAGLAIRVLGRPARRQRPRVLSQHAQVSADQRSAEVSVVLHDGEKVRAIALRLEAFRGRWRASAIEIG